MHLTETQLLQLAEDRLPAGERREAVRHLLTRCPPCLELARKVLFPELEATPDYSNVFRHLELALVLGINDVEVEKRRARALWDGYLAPLDPGRRLMALRSNPDLRTWGIFDLLLTKAKRITPERPVDAVDLAYAALTVADHLDPQGYGAERIQDYRAAAWATLANAKRLAGDFPGAGEALRAATDRMEQGTGDPCEEINILSMTASLLTDLGDFENAADLLQHAIALARLVRDRPLEGRLRIHQSSSIGWIDPARGLKLAESGLKLLRRSKSNDRHTELGGLHLTALWSNELGDFEEAREILETYRPLYVAFADPWTETHLLLLDALISRNEGRLDHSERQFRHLVEHTADHGMTFDLTLATLEWSESLVLQGRHREATEVLQEAYPLIEQWGAPMDILRAWKLVEESVRQRLIHHEAFRDLALTIRRHWHRKS